MFNIANIRAQFPILKTRVHQDKPLVYLDSGASSQKHQAVIDKMIWLMQNCYANVHRGAYCFSEKLTSAYEDSRQKVASFINANSNEVVFTGSTTNAINLVAHAFGRGILNKGDEVLITLMEHHSNFVPWQLLRDDHGVVLKFVTLHQDGSLDLENFKSQLSHKTKLVCVTHISNVLGIVNPIKEMTTLAHQYGAKILVDGSQAVMHLKVDVKELDVDFYVFTGHKVYGPTGIGILYARRLLLEAMPPFMGGGEMITSVTPEKSHWAMPPARFEAGTPPIIEAIALGDAIDFIADTGIDAIQKHENTLLEYAQESLAQIDGLIMYGNIKHKAPILSFNIHPFHPHDLAMLIDMEGVAVRAGHHCAEPLANYLGIKASLRVSMAIYNTCDEIDILTNALKKAQKVLKQ